MISEDAGAYMNVYLIGLPNHGYQYTTKPLEEEEGKKESYHLMKSLAIKKQIDCIAEEFSEDALKLWEAKDSISRMISVELGIEHCFCDPNREQRDKLGIKTKIYDDILDELGIEEGREVLSDEERRKIEKLEELYWSSREKFWLDKLNKLKGANFKNCLFISAFRHTNRFHKLLMKNSYSSVILVEKWQPSCIPEK